MQGGGGVAIVIWCCYSQCTCQVLVDVGREHANMIFFYRKGTSNSKPDTLLTRLEDRAEKGGGGDQLIHLI
jgi:uncharacterized membrane-anchored protein